MIVIIFTHYLHTFLVLFTLGYTAHLTPTICHISSQFHRMWGV